MPFRMVGTLFIICLLTSEPDLMYFIQSFIYHELQIFIHPGYIFILRQYLQMIIHGTRYDVSRGSDPTKSGKEDVVNIAHLFPLGAGTH